MEKDLNDEIRIIKEERNKRLIDIFSGEIIPDDVLSRSGEVLVRKKTKLTRSMLSAPPPSSWRLSGSASRPTGLGASSTPWNLRTASSDGPCKRPGNRPWRPNAGPRPT